MGWIRNAYRILDEKSEGKRSLGRPRHRCEDNIKIYIKGSGYEVVDRVHLAQGMFRSLVNTVMNLSIKSGELLD
jgi:hypothetical protein